MHVVAPGQGSECLADPLHCAATCDVCKGFLVVDPRDKGLAFCSSAGQCSMLKQAVSPWCVDALEDNIGVIERKRASRVRLSQQLLCLLMTSVSGWALEDLQETYDLEAVKNVHSSPMCAARLAALEVYPVAWTLFENVFLRFALKRTHNMLFRHLDAKDDADYVDSQHKSAVNAITIEGRC